MCISKFFGASYHIPTTKLSRSSILFRRSCRRSVSARAVPRGQPAPPSFSAEQRRAHVRPAYSGRHLRRSRSAVGPRLLWWRQVRPQVRRRWLRQQVRRRWLRQQVRRRWIRPWSRWRWTRLWPALRMAQTFPLQVVAAEPQPTTPPFWAADCPQVPGAYKPLEARCARVVEVYSRAPDSLEAALQQILQVLTPSTPNLESNTQDPAGYSLPEEK